MLDGLKKMAGSSTGWYTFGLIVLKIILDALGKVDALSWETVMYLSAFFAGKEGFGKLALARKK